MSDDGRLGEASLPAESLVFCSGLAWSARAIREDLHVQGVYSVLATPFRQGGDVDVESLRRYVEHFVGAGVTGFTALGVLGEAARLTERERALVLDRAAHLPRAEPRRTVSRGLGGHGESAASP
jgi:hypothetical protein